MRLGDHFFNFDLYGFKPFFYINGNKYYSTLYGFIVTIFCLICFIVVCIYFLIDMFNRNNFTIVTSTINPEKPLSITFSNETFYLGLGIQDPITYDFILDESIYWVEAVYKKASRLSNGSLQWEEEPVEVEECQLEKFPNKYRDLFTKRSVKNLYCVKNLKYKIEGTFLHDVYSFLLFNFYQCKNTTLNGNKCKSSDVIDYYLNGTFAAVEFTDVSIDPTNYDSPDIPMIGEGYSTVSNKFFREMHVFFKLVSIKQDHGYIFSNYDVKEYVQLDYVKDMLTIVPKEEFCSITVKISNRVDTSQLRYVKFQTTIANIGGILKIISIAGTAITFFYCRNKYEIDLINSIFFIKKGKDANKVSKFKLNTKRNYVHTESPSTQKKHFSFHQSFSDNNRAKVMISSQFGGNNISNINLNLNIDNDEKKEKNSIMTNLNYSTNIIKNHSCIKLSAYQLMFSAFCFKFFIKNEKIKLFYKAACSISERLDILNYIKDSINFHRLLKMLLTNEQYTLFNLVYKPYLGELNEKCNFCIKNSDYISAINKIKDESLDLYCLNTKGGLISNSAIISSLDQNLKCYFT